MVSTMSEEMLQVYAMPIACVDHLSNITHLHHQSHHKLLSSIATLPPLLLTSINLLPKVWIQSKYKGNTARTRQLIATV